MNKSDTNPVGRQICRHCDAYVDAPTATPEFQNPMTWHGEAKCVEGEEPIR